MSAARMTSLTAEAHARVEFTRAQLDVAERAVETATTRLHAARSARAAATPNTSAKDLSGFVTGEAAAEAHLVICKTAHAAATAALEAAMRAVVHAERADVLAAQHQRGVLPIVAIERDVQRLAREIDALRAKQAALFVIEVAPRCPSWYRGSPFEQGPPGMYESLRHLLAMHYAPEPPRAATATAQAPALASEVP